MIVIKRQAPVASSNSLCYDEKVELTEMVFWSFLKIGGDGGGD
jgi:hypothetical protein